MKKLIRRLGLIIMLLLFVDFVIPSSVPDEVVVVPDSQHHTSWNFPALSKSMRYYLMSSS